MQARDSVPTVRESDGRVRLSNGRLALSFDLHAGGAVCSVLDEDCGCDLIRDTEAPRTLFRLALLHAQSRQMRWVDARECSRLEWEQSGSGDEMILRLAACGFPDSALRVEVSVALTADSSLSRWRVHVSGVSPEESVAQLVCPVLSGVFVVGDPAPGECLAVPVQSEGFLFRNPFPVVDHLPLKAGAGPESPHVGIGEWHGRYPGQIPVQFMLAYNHQAGLYMATHDAGQHVKTLDVAPADWSPESPVMSISHLSREARGAEYSTPYETIVGVFQGDWTDGADIYKVWARQQWWCERKLAQRDIPDWFRQGFGVFQMSNYHIPVLKLNHSLEEIAQRVNQVSKQAGVPLLALIFNWEGRGAWTGPVGFFPPREGEEAFARVMQELRAAGNHGFVYMPGGNWYVTISSYEPPFDSSEQFELQARASAVVDVAGRVPFGEWFPGWRTARICPHTELNRRLTRELLVGAVQRGCTVVQVDNFPCGGADACYDPAHGHPPGPGPWWSEDWAETLAEARQHARAINPDCIITTEGVSEGFIPYLEMYDQRAGNMEYFGHWSAGLPMHGETIPLFGYVYSGYIGAYLAAMPECNRPEVLYWTRAIGKALTQGVVPTTGRYFPEPAGFNPETLTFYQRAVRAARECWKYIMFGEMLRPPDIQVPDLTASYLKFVYAPGRHEMDPTQRHEVRDRVVQGSAWRSEDGCIGYLFANISQQPVSFQVQVAAHADPPSLWDLELVSDGQRNCLQKGVTLPCPLEVTMEPLSILLVEGKPTDRGPVSASGSSGQPSPEAHNTGAGTVPVAGSLTQKERFVRTLRFEPVDRVPFMEIALWGHTLERWESEGMPPGISGGLMQGCPFFGLEGYEAVDLDIGPHPPYETRLLEETQEYELFVDGWGRTRRALKLGTVRGMRMSMDQHVDFPVRDRETLADMMRRFQGNPLERYPTDWEALADRARDTDKPLTILNPLAGTFGYYSMLRNWMGTERLSYLWYDDPGLIEQALDCLTDFALGLLEPALSRVRFDFYYIHEDLAGKGGPLIGPNLFTRFLLPHYRRFVDFLKDHGVRVVLVDTDGNFEALIPTFLEAGVDGFGPIEVAAGMDPVRLRRECGKSFCMVGGVDKREVARGRRAIDALMDEVVAPLVEDGGFIPTIDHAIPPDVSYDDFRYYLDRKRQVIFGHA